MSKTTNPATDHPAIADMAADPEYLASHGIRGPIVDTRTDAEKAKSKARNAALLALCAASSDDDAARYL